MLWILHLLGIVFWFGSLLAISLLPARGGGDHPADRAHGSLMSRLAWPGFAFMLLRGLGMMHSAAPGTLGGWFHVKLTLALLLLVLQVLMMRGTLKGRWLTALINLFLVGALYLVKLRPF
jgi:uncharacterized membrane protein